MRPTQPHESGTNKKKIMILKFPSQRKMYITSQEYFKKIKNVHLKCTFNKCEKKIKNLKTKIKH